MAEKSLKELSAGVYRIAENSPKIQKDVEQIRMAICGGGGMAESMVILSKTAEQLQRKNFLNNIKGNSKTIAKTDINKKLISNTDNIYKALNNIFAQIKKMGGKSFGVTSGSTKGLTKDNFKRVKVDEKTSRLDRISKSIDIVERLKSIDVKDFIFAKTKLKHIGKIMSQSLNMFRMFKTPKEMEKTISFIESSVDLVKKLSKISLLSKPAQWGAKAIEKILFGSTGKGGLVNTFRKLEKNKKSVESSRKHAITIAAFCGSMVVSAVALTAVAVLGPTALLGAVVTSGIVLLLTGTFKLLGKSIPALTKGSIAMALLGTGLLAFSVGFMILKKTTRDLKLKDVGVMVAAIAGTGLAIAGVGLLALPIAIGSGTLLLMGASLGILGLSLRAWENFDATKPLENIDKTVHGLKQTLGLEAKKENGEKPSFFENFKTVAGGTLNNLIGIIGGAAAFAELATIAAAVMTMDVIRLALIPWETYDSSKAANNITRNMSILKSAFFPPATNENGEKKGFLGNLASKLGNGITSVFNTISGVGQFAELATIAAAIMTMDVIRLTLIPWENYDGKKASDNIQKAIGNIKNALGFSKKEKKNEKKEGGLKGLLSKAGAKLADIGEGLYNYGSTFAQLGAISLALGTMDIIRLALIPWNNYDGKKATDNIANIISKLNSIIKGNSNTITYNDIDLFKYTVSGFQKGIKYLENTLKSLNVEDITYKLNSLHTSISKWTNDIVNNSTNISKSITLIGKAFDNIDSRSFGWKSYELRKLFRVISESKINPNYSSIPIKSSVDSINTVDVIKMKSITEFVDTIGNIRHSIFFNNKLEGLSNFFKSVSEFSMKSQFPSDQIKKSVENINTLDIEKAKVMIDMFKSFNRIRTFRPFDNFNNAVDRFVKACNEMIDSINNLENIGNTNIQSESTGESNITSTPSTVTGGVNINNAQQIADAIAQALRSLNIRLNPNMLDINLIAEGGSGKTVKLTLQD